MSNTVWVVYVNEAIDSDQSSYIIGVYATRELAEKTDKNYADEISKNCAYDTTERDTLYYETYDEGWYADNHYCIYAVEQEVKNTIDKC